MAENYFKIFSFFATTATVLFCFSAPLEANACGHKYYYEDIPKTCNGFDVGSGEVWEHYTSPCEKDGNPSCCDNDRRTRKCSSWQIAQAGRNDYGLCKCEKECLESPKNPQYYDNNAQYDEETKKIEGGKLYQNTPDVISLPIILAWDNIPEWQNEGKFVIGTGAPTVDYGARSYRVQIQSMDDAGAPDGIKGLNLAEAGGYAIENIGGKEAYAKVLQKNGFNSRDDGGACFFQTNSKYRWRVLPCCDRSGLQCKTYGDNEGWWEFSTSPAPELLGVNDSEAYAGNNKIAQDPDWNGPGALEGVDFCSAKLYWCKAKLVKSVPNTYNRFDKVYNDSQIDYAANYQMRVMSSENTSLGALIEKIENIPVLGGILGWIKNSGVVSGIKSRWDGWKNAWSGGASECDKWMESGIEKAAKSEVAVGEHESEACHYLQRNSDGSCAKPESLSFSPYTDQLISDATFKPFFSAAENTSQDRNLFTGSKGADLKYSWQIKPCFNVSGGAEDSSFPHCDSNIDEDFGQKWQLIGKAMDSSTLKPPAPISPAKNENWGDDNNLIGLNNTFNWTAPCGANSFLYDIQDENGESIFRTGDCQESYKNDAGRRFNKAQITIAITDKAPTQGKNPESVELKINTKYKWRVKSCWPSIPVGNINEICGGKWSEWQNFITTGRPPKNDSLQIANDDAPSATFIWESVPANGSFNVRIFNAAGKEVGIENPNPQPTNSYTFNYKVAKETYRWQVQTCADKNGTVCGPWSNFGTYLTKDFTKPTNLSPSGDISRIPSGLTWSSNAKYFLVTAKVESGEKSTSCDPDWFNNEYKEKIVSATSMAIRTADKNGSPYCAGNYSFVVQPCFDDKCASKGYVYAEQFFSIANKGQSSGLMVCGLAADDPNTQYNEKEPCEIKHLVLGTKVIIDFVVFKLAFILLPVMAMITGGMFYLSHDKANLIPTIKDGWKKIGIGYGILFFAWIIVSVLMNLVGYKELWNQIL